MKYNSLSNKQSVKLIDFCDGKGITDTSKKRLTLLLMLWNKWLLVTMFVFWQHWKLNIMLIFCHIFILVNVYIDLRQNWDWKKYRSYKKGIPTMLHSKKIESVTVHIKTQE